MRLVALLAALVLLSFGAFSARAHELRPAFLELTETGPETYDVLWKMPARGEAVLPLSVALPGNCTETAPRTTELTGMAVVSRWHIACVDGLAGKELGINGLISTYTDAIVRIAHMNGAVQSVRLTPDAPAVTIDETPTAWDTALTYFYLGVEHILFGFDHLLFVLALLLLIRNLATLIKTITAFTVAHSITLAAAALGWAHAPQPPVEAAIALSIVVVASEVVRSSRGRTDLSIRYPWLIAFLFGLLHGFGFGGALREIGLPQSDVPLALLTFNLGVEAGQLLFVAVVLAVLAIVRTVVRLSLAPARVAVAYGIGGIAAFWFIERLATF